MCTVITSEPTPYSTTTLNVLLFSCRYNGVNQSNMVLLDFEVPSGYVYQSWNYVGNKVLC